MNARHLISRSLFFVFVLASLVWAQSSPWQSLAQIKRGTKVQVVEQSLKSTSGRFVRFSETDLTLNVENKEVVISNDTAGLIGGCAGIGAGIGALIPSTKTFYKAEGSKQASPKEQSHSER